jgi:hypothetical protein
VDRDAQTGQAMEIETSALTRAYHALHSLRAWFAEMRAARGDNRQLLWK